MTGLELAEAARKLVGAPFRLHGRDPASGLDCIGVLQAACAGCGVQARLPNGYRLRSRGGYPATEIAARLGLRETGSAIETGDVLMLQPAPYQRHLAIATAPGSFIHAHAGLRRVVEGPIGGDWPTIAHWRLNPPRN